MGRRRLILHAKSNGEKINQSDRERFRADGLVLRSLENEGFDSLQNPGISGLEYEAAHASTPNCDIEVKEPFDPVRQYAIRLETEIECQARRGLFSIADERQCT